MGEDPTDTESGEGSATVENLASVLEFALAEWSRDPDWILDHWTDDMLSLMVRKHNERLSSGGATEESMTIDEMKVSQEQRYKIWKEMQSKSA